MTRLILIVGILLMVGLLQSLPAPLPGLFPATTAPVPPNELWELNRV